MRSPQYVEFSKMNSIENEAVVNGLGGGVLGGPNILRAHGVGFRPRVSLFGMGAMVWQGKTEDASVHRLQQQINVILGQIGYEPIAENGILGPATCGAIAKFGELGTLSNPKYKLDMGLMAEVLPLCDSWTAPTKKGASTPDPYKTTIDPSLNALPWNTKDSRTSKVQTDLNAQLVTHDYATIATNGVLDAPTCGAMKHADQHWGQTWMQAFGKNCRDFKAPTPVQKAKDCPEGFVAHEGDCKKIGGGAAGKMGMGVWLGIGGILAVGIGLWAMKAKKGRH